MDKRSKSHRADFHKLLDPNVQPGKRADDAPQETKAPQNSPISEAPFYNYMVAFRNSGLLYIEVPKCISTTIKVSMFMREFNIPQWAANILTDSAQRAVLYPRSVVIAADLNSAVLTKFAFIRNPWARMVSAYYNIGGSRHVAERFSFEQLIDGLAERLATSLSDQENAHFKPASYFMPRDETGRWHIDILGRVETCQSDWRHITDTARILPFELPTYNATETPIDYRSFYSARTRNIVGDLFAEDIQVGRYDF